MRVLVTGASGFVGHPVSARLLQSGHEVLALVRRPGSAPAGTQPVAGDMLDGDSLTRVLADTSPDCVVHLAAEIASQRDPVKVEAVNVAGTRHLLEACAALARAPKFVFTSTVVTGDAAGAELTEESTLPVQTAYGASKQAGEALVRVSGLDTVILRPSHVYGPGGLTAKALGVGAPRSVPVWLARRVGGRDPVAAMIRSAKSSNALIKRELGWSPQYATAEVGVPAAVAALGR